MLLKKKLIKNDLFYVPRLNWLEFKILHEKTIIFALANEVLINQQVFLVLMNLKIFN